ncbi:putative bifunctional diguanylate cyclase/phosphodiesterase [Nitratidesulfovibrio termitidis]|uniref:putative bifunctional diguanylate cyclase/phosphodiesterase n=1 Tax=Nitratidesulfovibrio termitidis TaxID=42252 RepID=UPI000557D98D|nr:GGDEF domain-containing phosphodiesterase [Nitratidesulfovibrio termitidis]
MSDQKGQDSAENVWHAAATGNGQAPDPVGEHAPRPGGTPHDAGRDPLPDLPPPTAPLSAVASGHAPHASPQISPDPATAPAPAPAPYDDAPSRARHAVPFPHAPSHLPEGDTAQSFRVLADHLADWESWEDASGKVVFVTPACQRITGYSLESFRANARFIEGIMHPEDLPLWRKHRDMVASGAEMVEVEVRVRTQDGRERWLACTSRRLHDADGASLGVRFSGRDVTDRKIMLTQMKHQAWHDPLTGLPNRALCLDRIDRSLHRARRGADNVCAVAFLDLDRFKVVNDSMGNAAGDQVLREVARRLAENTRTIDTVSRLGSDEFILLLDEVRSEEEALITVRRICASIEPPLEVAGRQIRISASVGVVMNRGGGNADEMLRNANIAMHHVKEHGGDGMAVFQPSMLEQAMNLMQLEIDLHRALDNNEFFLVYQPIMSLHDRKLTGFEALVRWNHPDRGIVGPSEFIPVSESTGQIHQVGRWVLAEACRALGAWREQQPSMRGVVMHVNLSARQLSQPGLVEQVAAVLRETGLPARCLKLEVTETMLMENPDYANMVLRRLKEIGVRLCIDDFGTGYSSLSYLQQFPIDTLKVDQSFVARMCREPGHFKIVQAVVALAHSLGLDVVAEGVEEEEQRIMLSELSCEGGQGYLFSRPVPGEDVPAMFGPKGH